MEKNYEAKIDDLERKFISRIEELEDKLAKKTDAFDKVLDKQNETISLIESNVKEIKETTNKTATSENEVVKKGKEKFKCNVCDFETNSKQGLRVHIKRKHTRYAEEDLPTNCEICDYEFKTNLGAKVK